jgi:hypothetical protein
MSNRIYGRITDSARADMPLGGLRVQVWDRDLIGGDDFMGETISDADGRYEIRSQPGTWEEADGILELGRPDIYITVDNRNKDGKWVRLGESDEHKNHDLSQDLRIDLQLALGEPISVRTAFFPDQHGFHFRNIFVVEPDLLGIDLGSWEMGFCGGMCAGALHRFRIGAAVPDDELAPPDGNPLHEELKVRQVKAMSLKMLPQMFEWQSAPEVSTSRKKTSIGHHTVGGWPALKALLDEGKPTILVLIRASGLLGNPTVNHQVLATGYDLDPATLDLVVHTYDPNEPDTTQTLSLNLGLPDGRLDLVDSASNKTRGFFVNPVGEEAVEYTG